MQITTQETAAYSVVLEKNDQGDYTAPADLYPHQWLWDSCFIAIGLRHTDPDRAAKELKSILRGQWSNGMLPNMIFKKNAKYRVDRRIWRSKISGQAPKHVATSGITQPPMLAQAVLLVGEKLEAEKQKLFFEHMLTPIVDYHEWLYNERDPHHEGLVLQIHPYETGLDNTSPWTKQLYEHEQPWWISVVSRLRLITIINFLRRDVRGRNPWQRMKSTEALILWNIIQRFKRKRYKISKILKHSLLSMQDVTFNSILAHNNYCLELIAQKTGTALPHSLSEQIKHTNDALEKLYDQDSRQYYSRDFITHELIVEPSIGTFLPLYSGKISQKRAEQLEKQLRSNDYFWKDYPVSSVPHHSSFFEEERYWQGPTWINTNWMIIEGLRRYGFNDTADYLKKKTIELIRNNGVYEYYSAIDGHGLGARDFSWTAALMLDLLNT